MVGTGFEPVKAMPADLQSAPVGRLGIAPFTLGEGRKLRHTLPPLSTQGNKIVFEPNKNHLGDLVRLDERWRGNSAQSVHSDDD